MDSNDPRSRNGRSFAPGRHTSPHDKYRSQRTPPRGPTSTDQRQPGRRDLDYDEPSDHTYSASFRRRTPPRELSRTRYRDRDNESYATHRSRSRSRSPPRRGRARSPQRSAPPNRDIIMEGLPLDMNEKDIKSELDKFYKIEGINEVRVIKDRSTGSSRGFGFLQFASVQAASTFLDHHQPEIKLQGKSTETTRVSISYSRQREERDRPQFDEDWICSNCTTSNYARRAECFKCQASKLHYNAGPPPIVKYINTGDSDASPDATPSQFLLLRGLNATVTEELLAKGVAKLYKIADSSISDTAKKAGAKVVSTTATTNFGAQEGSIKRVFVVRERQSDDSWRYGFVEFHSVEDAQAAYTKFHAMDKFTIASKPVIISYIDAGVFVPAANEDEAKYSFAATTNPYLQLSYWDQKAYLKEQIVSETAPNSRPSATAVLASADPASVEGLVSKDGDGKAKKRKAEASSSGANKKALPSHLQFWKDRHNELHGGSSKAKEEGASQRKNESSGAAKTKELDAETPPSQSYADSNKKCCYLCSRQFKTDAEVNKHERLSQLHRDNLLNNELVAKASAKLVKAGVLPKTETVPAVGISGAEDTQEYRDRAKERREVYGQPKRPTAPGGGSAGKSSNMQPESEEMITKAPSKGASLLGKMGWTEGQGLGAQGSGNVAPIAQNVYAEGVGLGAAGGKLGDAVEEAERRTKGDYGSFLEKTRDTARGRYEAMKKDG